MRKHFNARHVVLAVSGALLLLPACGVGSTYSVGANASAGSGEELPTPGADGGLGTANTIPMPEADGGAPSKLQTLYESEFENDGECESWEAVGGTVTTVMGATG